MVFEAGINDRSRAWPTIQAAVAQETRTLSYDRAGRGQSHWVPFPRSARDAAADLSTLLAELAPDSPVILVAHSFGGFIARIYASCHPVAGMILIDAAHEDSTRLTAPLYAKLNLNTPRFDPEWLTLARFDKAQNTDPHFPRNLTFSEGLEYETSRQQVIEAGHLGDLPLTIIAAGKREQLRRFGAQGDIAKLDADWEDAWKECQRRLINLSNEATFIEATESDHYVRKDQPDLVIAAIISMVRKVKGRF